MTTARSFQNQFEVTDYTQELNVIPNTWGLIGELGIFSEQGIAQNSLTFESKGGTIALVGDKVRGTRANVGKDEVAKIHAYATTHHPYDDALFAHELQGRRAYGTTDQPDTEARAIADKLARIRMAHAMTLERARAWTIVNGTQYAPNGTVSANFYTDFGVTRKSVDCVLGTATTEVNEKIQEGVASIQDNLLSGEVATGFAVLCGTTFFNKLTRQANIKEAYKFYASTQEGQRNGYRSGRYQIFDHAGVRFIEYRGSLGGQALIPDGEAYMIPTGTMDTFKTYFSPASKFDLVNTIGEQAYVWTYKDQKGSKIEVESESNFLNLLRRPQAVVQFTSSN